jgi:peptide/nickel transport system permease protein
MLKYIVKRILIFIPTLIAISLLAFIISITAPADPVEKLTNSADKEGAANQQSDATKKIKQELRKKLGLDLPIFYFNFGSLSDCDTLYKIDDKDHIASLSELTHLYGNWPNISAYYHQLIKTQLAHDKLNLDEIYQTQDSLNLVYTKNQINDAITKSSFEISAILETAKPGVLASKMSNLDTLYLKYDFLKVVQKEYELSKKHYNQIIENNSHWKTYIPKIVWYGSKNQYHFWLFGNTPLAYKKSSFPYFNFKYKHYLSTNSLIGNTFLKKKVNFYNTTKHRTKVLNKTNKLLSSDHYLGTKNFIFSSDSISSIVSSDSIYNSTLDEQILLIDQVRWDNSKRYGVLRGDFGISYIDNQPISIKIWNKVWISFSFSILSVLFAYIISIPLGIYSAYKKDSKFDRISSIIVFVLYSMPGFFIGVLLLYTFANPDTLRWFPVSGIQDPSVFDPSWSLIEKVSHRLPYFVLPLVTYTYSSFAFLSRIMRVGVIDVFNQDYIRTARAKGLGEGKVVMKHALRNSLLPIITVFANIFPLAIGGSVIIETIFTIPGMGFEIYNSILNSDYPMIVAVFTIIGFLTMLGYLIADILYAVVDPRISYK